MIPKTIHYCWFGHADNLPKDAQFCISTWKKRLSGYDIVLWNESNFDVSQCRYAEEALAEGKYAFVSDYVRLWVLYHYGGIYLDSDVEVLRSFDDLLDRHAFTCFEDVERVAAWIFGSEKGNPLFKEFLDDYNGRRFVLGKGLYDLTPNPVPITNRLKSHGLRLDGSYQDLGQITVFSMDYFCPFNPYRKSGDCFTENTYANHHFNGSWQGISNSDEDAYRRVAKRYERLLGKKMGSGLHELIAITRHSGLRTGGKYIMHRLERRISHGGV